MALRYGSRSRPGTMVSTWLNGLVSGTVIPPGAVYFAGGATVSWARLDTINKFSYLDDSRTTLSATLTNGAYDAGGCSNANVAGYFMGGNILSPYGATALVQKLDFSAETTSNLGTGLSAANKSFSAMANNAVAGYTAGGSAGGGTVDKFAFPSDSRTTLGTGLSGTDPQQTMAMANSGTAGYVALGSPTGGRVDTVNKFAFSDDSRTTLSTGTSVAGGAGAGLGNKDVAGYMCQGYSTTYIATVDKFAFPSDSRSTIASRATGAAWLGGGSNSGTAGYIGGGEVTGAVVDTVDKLDYSADTWSVLSTGLVVGTAFGPVGLANDTSLL